MFKQLLLFYYKTKSNTILQPYIVKLYKFLVFGFWFSCLIYKKIHFILINDFN
jgi:hypothetical protein